MTAMASQITSLTIVYLIVYSGTDQIKYQSSTSLAFVWGIHRGPVNSPHKGPVTRKMFPFDDVIMLTDKNSHTAHPKYYAHYSRFVVFVECHMYFRVTSMATGQLNQSHKLLRHWGYICETYHLLPKPILNGLKTFIVHCWFSVSAL